MESSIEYHMCATFFILKVTKFEPNIEYHIKVKDVIDLICFY